MKRRRTVKVRVVRTSHIVNGVLVVKITVMVGIVASYFVPAEVAAAVGIGTNLLWLWRT